MARKTKRDGRRARKRVNESRARRGQKVSEGDTRGGRRQAALDAVARQRAEFARRKRAQLAKALLELDHVDGEIFQLLMQHPKITHQTIGDSIGLSRKQVNLRIKAGKFQRALHESTRSAVELFEENKTAAARRLGTLIHHADPNVSIRACIAHLWPHIHATDERTSVADFVKFIEEAYERANDQETTDGR